MLNTTVDVIDALYRLYEQSMYYEALKILHDEHLAEDAVHEAFLKLIRNRNKIVDPKSHAARRYVYKTINSVTLDLYRSQKKQRDRCCEFSEEIENTCAAETLCCDTPLSLISELPDKYASVMRCLFIDGLSIKETAAVLKISEDSVRKRCERARKRLKATQTNSKTETRHEG